MHRMVLTVMTAAVLAGLPAVALASTAGPPERDDTRQVMFVGNNWEGTATLIDSRTFQPLLTIDTIPDEAERMAEIQSSPDKLGFFLAIQQFIGEGNNQYTDDMFTSHDGRFVYVSRPSFADVVSISLETGEIQWRFEMEGYRSDHMGISPDGTTLVVSDSTANKAHVLDTATGEKLAEFASGDSPHENVFSADGTRLFHASIGRVYTPTDRPELGPVRDSSKGDRRLQVVDTADWSIIDQWDIGAELDQFAVSSGEAERAEMSAAVRPMAISPDEAFAYFQVSFHFGFVEFDLEAGEVTRVYDLPLAAAEGVPPEEYVLDSAHHGMALNPQGDTFCIAGTMSDYLALVDRETGEHEVATTGSKPYWSTNGRYGETCWISWSGDDEVSVVDYATGEEVARVPVGDHPQRVRPGVIREEYLAAAGVEGTTSDQDAAAREAPDEAAAAGPGLPSTGGAPAVLAVLVLAAAGAMRRRDAGPRGQRGLRGLRGQRGQRGQRGDP